MPKPPDPWYLSIVPTVIHKSDRYYRVWELLDEMDLRNEVVFSYIGNTELQGLCFPSKEQAMIFKLRL